jgi:hypothetical protein
MTSFRFGEGRSYLVAITESLAPLGRLKKSRIIIFTTAGSAKVPWF